MAKLLTKTNSLGVVVTDIKEKALFERLHQLSEGRIMSVQKSGFAMSALLCVLPL
jgi:hypothetical protein